jgi:crotonobetainyl-CoA:carnitine CoA-transferase CaiB-like acyl-CoA transferase
VWRAAPTIGQDNEYVFGELLGMSSQQIADLLERKIIN